MKSDAKIKELESTIARLLCSSGRDSPQPDVDHTKLPPPEGNNKQVEELNTVCGVLCYYYSFKKHGAPVSARVILIRHSTLAYTKRVSF